MGRRGPQPAPTALKLLKGTTPCRINNDEPVAPEGAPELPDSVTGETRQVWHHTVKQLAAMGLLSTADRDTLLCYCEAVVSHRRASEALAEEGVIVRGALGSWVKNPAASVQNEAATQIARYAGMFGLSPSARSSIKVGQPKGGASDVRSADRFLTG